MHRTSDPHASANCTATGAFETPSLVSGAVSGTRLSIPAEYRSGAGLGGSEVLACDLLEPDCCDAFDEDVCLLLRCVSQQPRASWAGGRSGS